MNFVTAPGTSPPGVYRLGGRAAVVTDLCASLHPGAPCADPGSSDARPTERELDLLRGPVRRELEAFYPEFVRAPGVASRWHHGCNPLGRMPYLHVALALLLALVVPTGRAEAGPPTDQLKQHVNEVVRQMEDPALQASPAQRRAAVRRISEQIFDYKETARRALGRHWNARTPQERDEFVRLFADLLDRAYFSRIDQYKGERVRYADETIDGAEAVVNTVIVTGRGSEVPVDYRMRLADGRWLVYDVNVEGVSLVANYRTQFNKIVETESYESLVRKLRAREASPAASGRSDRPLTQR